MKTSRKNSLILANGKAPSFEAISYFLNHRYPVLYCADGGANSAKKLGVIPDYIIGDLDSVSNSTLKYFDGKSEIIKLERQNDTDVEKCIKHAIKNKVSEAVLTGVTGNRLDHTICNLGIILKFYKKIKLKIYAERSLLIPYSGKVEIKTVKGETISLYGFDLSTKITSEGLLYPLNNISLPFGNKESTSNVATEKKIKLQIRGGVIFLVRDFKTMRQNDLI